MRNTITHRYLVIQLLHLHVVEVNWGTHNVDKMPTFWISCRALLMKISRESTNEITFARSSSDSSEL